MGNKSTDGFILDFGTKLPWKQQMTVAFQRLKWKAGLRESDRRAAESSQERQSILCWDQAVRGQLQTDHKCHLVVYWPKWPTETLQVKTVDFICWTGGNDSRIWLQRHLNFFFFVCFCPILKEPSCVLPLGRKISPPGVRKIKEKKVRRWILPFSSAISCRQK